MKRLLLPFITASLAIGLFAGTGTEIGSASVEASPEFATIDLWVKSQCYPTPAAALADNDKFTSEVQTLLGKFVNPDNQKDKVYHEGGVTSEYQHAVYVNGHDKILCPNTFQKISKVTLVTENINNFSAMFASIQTEALNKFNVRNSSANSDVPTTFITINQPSVDVCEQKRVEMQNKALALATQNAQDKFWSCAKQCGIDLKTVKIVGINPPSSHEDRAGKYFSRASAESAPSAPSISFRNIQESATVEVSFTFEDSNLATCMMQCRNF